MPLGKLRVTFDTQDRKTIEIFVSSVVMAVARETKKIVEMDGLFLTPKSVLL